MNAAKSQKTSHLFLVSSDEGNPYLARNFVP
jgi:hypothetical protein